MKIPYLLKQAWFFVVLGTLLTIASALMGHYFVDANNSKIDATSAIASELDNRIRETWQNTQNLERKKDMLLLLKPLLAQPGFVLSHYVEDALSGTGITLGDNIPQSNAVLHTLLLKNIDLKKQELINQINDIYVEKTRAEDKIMALKKDNDSLANIALFLQIIGLILVLAKDVGRTIR